MANFTNLFFLDYKRRGILSRRLPLLAGKCNPSSWTLPSINTVRPHPATPPIYRHVHRRSSASTLAAGLTLRSRTSSGQSSSAGIPTCLYLGFCKINCHHLRQSPYYLTCSGPSPAYGHTSALLVAFVTVSQGSIWKGSNQLVTIV